MFPSLSIIMILGSVLTFFFITRYIRKAKMRIEDTIFWIFFCAVLIGISLFPQIPIRLSEILGFQAPINLIFILIIFILIVNQFYMSVKISQMQIKQKELVQRMALDRVQKDQKEI